MTEVRAEYVEIDLPSCLLQFGETNEHGTCTATGVPCFNTRNNSFDCADIPNYTPGIQTVRFVTNNGLGRYWPDDGIPTFKLLKSDSLKSTGARLDPAESMGERAKLSFVLENSQSLLAGLDKNIIARDDNDYYKGTFLGKFKARNPYIYGSEVRAYKGTGDGSFSVEHYTIDSFSGPGNSSQMEFKCLDFLILTNGESSNYPRPNNGVVDADFDEVATQFTLSPVGIGDAEYPASGMIAVGNEGMPFTRVGDVMTVARGAPEALGEISSHKAGDTAQVIGVIDSERSCDIIYNLIDEYSPVPASTMNLPDWQEEIDNFQSARYSANIVEPTPVSKLINEIIQQAGLIFWADVELNKIQLRALRPNPDTKSIDMGVISGFQQKEKQALRVSQIWTYYNQKNPFKKLDDRTNYHSRAVSLLGENLYPNESIRRIYSRWIPSGGETNALELNARIIERYKNPPSLLKFGVPARAGLRLGQSISIDHRAIEGAFGDVEPSSCYVTRHSGNGLMRSVEANEFQFFEYTGPGGGADRIIPIEQPFSENIVLRELYDSVRSSLIGVNSVRFIVRPGSVIGSRFNTLYAMSVGDFDGVPVTLQIDSGGFIVGKAGDGVGSGIAEGNGGPALLADYPLTIDSAGIIGGGGGSSGVGTYKINLRLESGSPFTLTASQSVPGAGYRPGQFTIPNIGAGPDITYTAPPNTAATSNIIDQFLQENSEGLVFSNYGNGGGLGQAGTAGDVSGPFNPGNAIDGMSNITFTNTGTILGATS